MTARGAMARTASVGAIIFAAVGIGLAWLVAALRRAWDAERARRDELRTILDSIGDGVTVTDAGGMVRDLKRSELQLAFLAEVSAILGGSADDVTALRRVAELAVPDLADWCVLDVVDRGGARCVALAHADPAKVRMAEEVERRWPQSGMRAPTLQMLTESRQTIHIPQVRDEMLREAAQDEEHLATLRRLAIHAVLTVPLVARGDLVGALTLVSAESRRPFLPLDIALAEEVARRAGAAIEQARLLHESHEALRLRNEFMAIASHDMRTPLATVRGYAQLARRRLNDGGGPGSVDDMLRRIDASASRLTRMVSEFMDASLVRGGEPLSLQVEATDLVSLVREIVGDHLGQMVGGHRIVVRPAAKSVPASVDPARLGRILDNLLTNAVKFSPSGGEIVVEVGESSARPFISVRDRGIGIAGAELTRIFEPGYRGSNTEQLPGMGLGLAGSRAVLRQMDGEIEVESELGKSSTFTLRLPPVGMPAAGPPAEQSAVERL